MEHRTAVLVERLAQRIIVGDGRKDEQTDKLVGNAFRYAIRIIGSRIAPSMATDESSASDSIKRLLSHAGKGGEVLRFQELHRRLTDQPGLQSRCALLHAIKAIAEDRHRDGKDAAGGGAGAAAYTFASTLAPAPPGDALSLSRPGSAASRATESRPATPAEAATLAPRTPGGPKAAAHKQYLEIRDKESFEIPEEALVRDVVFVLQGIDGQHIKFDVAADSYIVDPAVGIPKPTRELLRRLCELGWMFRRVRSHVASAAASGAAEKLGSVGQAFCTALQAELSDYYRLVTVLEAQAQHAVGGAGPYLTLRRLSVWTAEAAQRMRLMAVLVDSAKFVRGGALAAAIHAHALHGDPFACGFVTRILRQVCSPIFIMIRRWLYEGELEDAYKEFFVAADPSVPEGDLWRRRYRLEKSMLLPFVPLDLAKKILRAGKSINFLRTCCSDRGWYEEMAGVAHAASAAALEYGQAGALEAVVREASTRIDRRLMQILFDKFHFRQQCLAVKRYLLLGQGDFIQYLMDLVGPDLGKKASEVSAYKLMGTLESAVRASNAQYDESDIINRLKVKMMPHVGQEVGWDVFSLEYVTTSPLSTVFTDDVMTKYLRVFNFLWRLKRVEVALSSSWQLMKPNRLMRSTRTGGAGGGRAARDEGVAAMEEQLRRCHALRGEMNHFCSNLQYYTMFEVLEESWTVFVQEMNAAADLDELILAHDKYLGSITEKALLGVRLQPLAKHLAAMFDVMLRFRAFADRLCDAVAQAGARRVLAAGRAEANTAQGKWGSTGGAEAAFSLEFIRETASGLDSIGREYSSLLEAFVALLAAQRHVDLRSLIFRLDFSEYYSQGSSLAAGGGNPFKALTQ